jgi:hypothetical protein
MNPMNPTVLKITKALRRWETPEQRLLVGQQLLRLAKQGQMDGDAKAMFYREPPAPTTRQGIIDEMRQAGRTGIIPRVPGTADWACLRAELVKYLQGEVDTLQRELNEARMAEKEKLVSVPENVESTAEVPQSPMACFPAPEGWWVGNQQNWETFWKPLIIFCRIGPDGKPVWKSTKGLLGIIARAAVELGWLAKRVGREEYPAFLRSFFHWPNHLGDNAFQAGKASDTDRQIARPILKKWGLPESALDRLAPVKK